MATASSSRRRLVSILVAVALVGQGLVAGVAPAQAQVQTYSCPTRFGAIDAVAPVPPILIDSLKVVPNPVLPKDPFTGQRVLRADLVDYVANLNAAIQLGKALFWDMQVGSDNKTACATCHNQAGADGRNRNQLNPGANGAWDAGYVPNQALWEGDFPFTSFDGAANLIDRTDNAAGSQGVRNSTFVSIKNGAESTTSVADPVFSVSGKNVRRVTGVNTPSAVNAVFNHRQFFNGRAQPEFNGVNPFGNRDASARVWVVGSKGAPVTIDIHIQNASLASQAVGPVLNPTEMSADKRSFADVGQKMLAAKPLNGQKVSPTDSVLGPLADTTTGLKTTYTALIQQAFQPKWWNANKSVSITTPTGIRSYSMMAANFSLFWGLSVMLYEANLVSDDSPMDQYLALVGTARPGPGDPTAAVLDQLVNRLASEGVTVTRDSILSGLHLFEAPVAPAPSFPPPPGFGAGCTGCHFGGELTSASMRNLTAGGLEPGDVALKNAGFDIRMERMFKRMDWTPPGPLTPVPAGTDVITFDPSTYAINVTGIYGSPVTPIPLPVVVYDAGWYNLGVRPTAEDPGLGGKVFGAPLSWTEWFQSQFASVKVPGGGLGCGTTPPGAPLTSPFAGEVLNPLTGFPLLAGSLKPTETTDVAGTFKVPGLHNVELTGPYFHNGGKATLRQVIEFYDEGGNFANPTRSPLMTPLGLSATQMDDLIAFLLSWTDERVRLQQAPFDHPQLFVPNGDNPAGTDAMVELPVVGAGGSSTPLGRFLNLNPF